MSHEERLTRLGVELPGPFAPHDPLVGCVVVDGIARTSGALPRQAPVEVELTVAVRPPS